MQSAIFENARILDGSSDEGEHDRFVRVADGLIKEISDKPIKDSAAHRIDLRGKTLMPGLIDCHTISSRRSPTLLTTRDCPIR